ncbi:lpxtg-domain-containing protein cell wall anchor domain [Diplodia corticola]|uniref:Lpxtg-domain-containing protein cell wall anchor domain n=1 Tax=Diplodia corticola TaxID=236234 RepID=A0A1J9SLX7_9PEZI|nr:lpxtg-domain-containing protein cell wall anchor domain [Diplodia corticola]OJD40613.1 lpxtg-domain-containing protein cell wall anchor domain [Diplodia corticola]
MTQPVEPQSFASGLESFGSIDWDAEYDELVAADDTTSAQSEPEQLQPEGPEAINTAPLVEEPTSDLPYPDNTTYADHTPFTMAESPDQTVTTDTMSSEHEHLPDQYGNETPTVSDSTPAVNFVQQPGSFAAWTHPGWCWNESPSCYEWTATSPEVSAWAMSPGIWSDANWIIGAARQGDDYAHDDIPRIASLLQRAFDYTYDVSGYAGVCFPALARGFKAVPRRGTGDLPREQYQNRGAKGLRRDRRGPSLEEEYVPMGETSKMQLGVYFPRPSRLSDVWTAENEDDEDEKEQEEMGEEEEMEAEEMEAEAEAELVESSEEGRACLDGRSCEETEGATPSAASEESSINSDNSSCSSSDSDDDHYNSSISDAIDEDEIPAIPSRPAILMPTSPHTPVRPCSDLPQDQNPSPKLTSPGSPRHLADNDVAPQLSPALALADMNVGKKLAPPKSLYQSFVEKSGNRSTGETEGRNQDPDENHTGFWTNTAAAAIAIVGGMTVLLG